MNTPPITIDDRPPSHKRAQYTPDLLPAAISVAYENSVSTLTTPSDFPDILHTDYPNTLHVMKKYMPLKGRVHSGYCFSKHGKKRCYKKTRFYCSTCSDEDKIFYHCRGVSRVNLEPRTCLLEHQYSMPKCFI